jgi:antitoxin (DNA-binding transcriptional repressor) of toxin-antitoxin stability system
MDNPTHKAIPIYEAKTNLSKYIEQAKAGTPVYIGARGQAEVVLTVLPKQSTSQNGLWGSMKGSFKYSQTEWDEATRLVNEDFENSKIFPDVD